MVRSHRLPQQQYTYNRLWTADARCWLRQVNLGVTEQYIRNLNSVPQRAINRPTHPQTRPRAHAPTHLGVHRLRDDLSSLMSEASRLRTRNGRGGVRVAKQRQHLLVQVPLDACHSSTRSSPVRVDKRPQPERRPKRRVSTNQTPAQVPDRPFEGVRAGDRLGPGRDDRSTSSSISNSSSSRSTAFARFIGSRSQEKALEALPCLPSRCLCFRIALVVQKITEASVCITVDWCVRFPTRVGCCCGSHRHRVNGVRRQKR